MRPGIVGEASLNLSVDGAVGTVDQHRSEASQMGGGVWPLIVADCVEGDEELCWGVQVLGVSKELRHQGLGHLL